MAAAADSTLTDELLAMMHTADDAVQPSTQSTDGEKNGAQAQRSSARKGEERDSGLSAEEKQELDEARAKLEEARKEVERLEKRVAELAEKEEKGKEDPASTRRSDGKCGVRRRKLKNLVKGGEQATDCFEEVLWHPREIMPALASRPIGHIKTCFPRRNGCPRQGSVVPASRARLDLVFGSNPHHATDGMEEFSHVWLLFLFDGNGTNYCPRPHIFPPRLMGKAKGVFATRSPHRPLPIGLSLVALEAVEGRTLVLSGVDLVDGTPILDVKPYIPCYDAPFANGADGTQDLGVVMKQSFGADGLRYPEWCVPSAQPLIRVHFTPPADAQLAALEQQGLKPRVVAGWPDVRAGIVQVLQADPRSVYRKSSCAGQEYRFYFDCLDVSCIFNDDTQAVDVMGVEAADLGKQRAVKAGGDKVPAPASAASASSASASASASAPSASATAARAQPDGEDAAGASAALTAAMDAPIPIPRFVDSLSSSHVPPAESVLPSSKA